MLTDCWDAGEIVRLKASDTLCPEESVTVGVKGYEPASVVNPEIEPVEACNRIPEGKLPLATLH
jgi:hypothetical protein